MQPPRRKPIDLPVIGWREWVALPSLGIAYVKAKIDTGARTSALHAIDIEPFRRGGTEMVRFQVHPLQRDSVTTVACEAEVVDDRVIRSSSGHISHRPVIRLTIELAGEAFPIELTLVSRDEMGFRMLLGREAVRRRFLVAAGSSYRGGVPDEIRRLRKERKAKRKAREAAADHDDSRRRSTP